MAVTFVEGSMPAALLQKLVFVEHVLPVHFEILLIVAFDQIPLFVLLAQRTRDLRQDADDLLQRDHLHTAWPRRIVRQDNAEFAKELHCLLTVEIDVRIGFRANPVLHFQFEHFRRQISIVLLSPENDQVGQQTKRGSSPG